MLSLSLFNTHTHRPYNVLKVIGSFSLSEAHGWVRYCLPDVPDQSASEDVNTLYFKSTFIDTFLECTYKYVVRVKSSAVCTWHAHKHVLK